MEIYEWSLGDGSTHLGTFRPTAEMADAFTIEKSGQSDFYATYGLFFCPVPYLSFTHQFIQQIFIEGPRASFILGSWNTPVNTTDKIPCKTSLIPGQAC